MSPIPARIVARDANAIRAEIGLIPFLAWMSASARPWPKIKAPSILGGGSILGDHFTVGLGDAG